MAESPITFATEPDGSDIFAPPGTVRIQIRSWTPGKAGAPRHIWIEGSDEPFSVAPDAPVSALGCLPSGDYRGVFVDRAGKRLGSSFKFAVQRLGQKPQRGHGKEAPDLDPYAQRQIERLEAMVDKLSGLVNTLVETTVDLAKRAMETQIEIVKVMPKTIESSAKIVGASSSAGDFAEAATTVQSIIDNAPAGADSNLQAVLSSPVVVGAAAALQKYMAKAAENGAEAMVSDAGSRRESMAERAARISAAADNAAARRAVRS